MSPAFASKALHVLCETTPLGVAREAYRLGRASPLAWPKSCGNARPTSQSFAAEAHRVRAICHLRPEPKAKRRNLVSMWQKPLPARATPYPQLASNLRSATPRVT